MASLHVPSLVYPDSPGSSVFDLPVHNTASTPSPAAATADNSTTSLHKSIHTASLSSSSYPTANAPPPINSDLQVPSTASFTNDDSSATNNSHDDTPSFLVISGGTGGNAICAAFGNHACYVLPVSDDGGSSSEIIRVLGGPSVGDIRSRLIRLIPTGTGAGASALDAIRTLLAHRLPSNCAEKEAREQWLSIVEGRSQLWTGIPNDRKETIRGFLVHFESELLKRAQKNFSFVNSSIGNCFIAAAQDFFRSLPSAIFLFSSITNSQATILPVIVTNHTVTIAAELENGQRLVGQCEISHPMPVADPFDDESILDRHSEPWRQNQQGLVSTAAAEDGMDDAQQQPLNSTANARFVQESKADQPPSPLPARISRLYYMNAYGHEVHPSPNPDFIANLAARGVLIYSCGSLWTSIMPCLTLKGVAEAIARSPSLYAKVLLLNTENDRETGGYTAKDYISTIARTLNSPPPLSSNVGARRSHYHYQGLGGGMSTTYPVSAFVTHLVYLSSGSVLVDEKAVMAMGVRCIRVESKSKRFDAAHVNEALQRIVGSRTAHSR